MAFSKIRLSVAFIATGSLCSALCQTVASDTAQQQNSNPVLYRAFFQQVAMLKARLDRPTLTTVNGEAPTKPDSGTVPESVAGLPGRPVISTAMGLDLRRVAIPKIEDIMGLSETDVDILNSTATDCIAQFVPLDRTQFSLTFESRIQFVGSGKISKEVVQKLADLDEQRDLITIDHVRQLKDALKAESFQTLNAYVHATPGEKKSLMPPVTSALPPPPQAKPR